jgi:hypothetical protein
VGVDFLDCQFRIEREFQLPSRAFDHRKLIAPRDTRGVVAEVTGRHMLQWLELTLREQGREIPSDCWPRLRRCIAATVDIPVEKVELDVCLIHELGFG